MREVTGEACFPVGSCSLKTAINNIIPGGNYDGRQYIFLIGWLRYDRRECAIKWLNNKAPALIRAIEEIKAGARTTHYGSSELGYLI